MWALFFFLTTVAWAQPAAAPPLVFPDDSLDPNQAGGAEMLEAVCPGHVAAGNNIECKDTCPKSSSYKNDDFPGWTLTKVTRGHFLSAKSDDAALDMAGCEPGNNNYGGTILLSKQAGKWTMLWYRAGVPTFRCHRQRIETGREILICLGEAGSAGIIGTELYLEDLTSPARALRAGRNSTFFRVQDNTSTCGENFDDESKPFPIKRGRLERVEFRNAADGTLRGLSVFASGGERTMTSAQVDACVKPNHGQDFWPPTKPYRVDFKFDGKRMVRTGGSLGAPK